MNADTDYLRLAIVEDEPQMGMLISDMLALAGQPSDLFTSGKVLLKSPGLTHYETIILDLSLPDIDGFALFESLVKSAPHVSLLLISGHSIHVLAAAQTYAQAIGCKVMGVLNKPFSKSELYGALGLTVQAPT